MSRKRLVLLGIALAAMLLAGSYSMAHARAQTAQPAPGGPGGGRAEPDVAFLVPNEVGDPRPDGGGVRGGQLRTAGTTADSATIDSETGLSIRQRLQLLREQGFSRAFIRLMRIMLIG